MTVERLSSSTKITLTLLLASTFVLFLNETILGVALPPIMQQLNITAATGQWLTTAYMLTMAVVIPTSGYLMQRLGNRNIFMIAMSLFTIGSLIAALATGFEMLLLGRIFQAAGTGVMSPLLMVAIMTLVPDSRRGSLMGTVSIVMSLAPAVGPTVSGLILSFAGWRWLFWLVMPIAAAALILGIKHLPTLGQRTKAPLDIMSVILAAITFSSLVYGLSSFAEQARGVRMAASPEVIVAVGAALLALFIWRQIHLQKQDRALLDLRTFRARSFTVAVSIFTVINISLFGTFILLPIYMQTALGLTPLLTGTYLLPGGLIMGFMGPVVGRWYDKVGARPLVIIGSTIASASLWVMATFNAATPVLLIPAAHIVLSVGLSLLFTPMFTFSMSSVPPQLYPHASSIMGTIQQVAGAAGTALFVTLFTAASVASQHHGHNIPAATIDGIRAAFIVGAVLSLVTLALSFTVHKPATDAEKAHELDH